jgi:hypothetical protein
MAWIEYVRQAPDARVLLVSQRLIAPTTWRCLLFNFEDVIATVDAVDIAAPLRPDLPEERRRLRAQRLDRLHPGAARAMLRLEPRPPRRYSLLFVSLQGLQDLHQLGPLSPWLAAADVAVCYVEELWVSEVPERPSDLALLRAFDLILLGCHGSVDAVAAATRRPCRYLAPGIDMLTFCPYPDPPARVIDIYAMGRRSAELHAALMDVAARHRLFYLYDTLSDTGVHHPADHRRHLAELIKRTRYFPATRPKFDLPGRAAGQQEVGFRFFEGAAGGAVLLGLPPDTPMFDQLFGWDDAVVPCTPDSIGSVIEALEADPGRVERIRRRNVVNSLRRHDCMDRWSEVLAAAGLPPAPGAEARRHRLAALMSSVWPDAARADADAPLRPVPVT